MRNPRGDAEDPLSIKEALRSHSLLRVQCFYRHQQNVIIERLRYVLTCECFEGNAIYLYLLLPLPQQI